ncbi:MAG: type II toxin-antitoxin system VapC family toxin, partial [Deltaproteobacteria bacterium]|nr:type II toxin-antitoxin system VapC family toxin [Deltaproteobacteria bacterium]
MIVADTHVIIWDALRPDVLSRKAKSAILRANSEDGIIFCEISLWEIAMLMKRGRIHVAVGFLEFVNLVRESNRYIFQGISPEIAELSSHLSLGRNKDPADKIIAATSIIQNARLITADEDLRRSTRV